jgi:hypothetical protein
VTELWTVEEAASHWGVSLSRARTLIAKANLKKRVVYAADEVRAVPRPGRGARTDLRRDTITVAGPDGHQERDGWLAYISDGGYTVTQQDRLADALLSEQAAAVNALLPKGWTWLPHTSEVRLPAGHVDVDSIDLDDLMRRASESVQAQFDRIEKMAIGS